jgi:hypothetical protein
MGGERGCEDRKEVRGKERGARIGKRCEERKEVRG